MKIVAIGGGELGDGETLPIDQFIVESTNQPQPKALLIPTASEDAGRNIEAFNAIYGGRLGCQTDHLLLYGQDRDGPTSSRKIHEADLIYVSGGNTLRMMKFWRKLGIDKALREAGQRGTVLAGLSAGAICWHAYGHSDSNRFGGDSEWNHIRVKGLGFLPGTFCPHLDAEQRHPSFQQMIQKQGGTGIACDNHAAVCYQAGKQPVVMCSRNGATARLYRRQRGKVTVEVYRDGDALPKAIAEE